MSWLSSISNAVSVFTWLWSAAISFAAFCKSSIRSSIISTRSAGGGFLAFENPFSRWYAIRSVKANLGTVLLRCSWPEIHNFQGFAGISQPPVIFRIALMASPSGLQGCACHRGCTGQRHGAEDKLAALGPLIGGGDGVFCPERIPGVALWRDAWLTSRVQSGFQNWIASPPQWESPTHRRAQNRKVLTRSGIEPSVFQYFKAGNITNTTDVSEKIMIKSTLL